jgi:hypothetical protein
MESDPIDFIEPKAHHSNDGLRLLKFIFSIPVIPMRVFIMMFERFYRDVVKSRRKTIRTNGSELELMLSRL